MAWKLRKDKLKTDTPDTDAPEDSLTAPETTSQAVITPPPPPDDTPDEPQFTETAPAFSDEEPTFTDTPQFTEEPQFTEGPSAIAMGSDAPISLGAAEPEPIALDAAPEPEPISMGAFTPYQPPGAIAPPAPDEPEFEEPSFDAEPQPDALAPPSVIAAPPPAEEATTEEPMPAPDFDREALAPGLVTTDTESGLPRVAPFVLDTPAAPETPSTPTLPSVVLRLGNLSATYFLVKDITTIGRPDSAVQNYPDIEVELDDGVSRQHAEIRRQDDAFHLVDVGSTNGTILNGQMLTPEQPAPLSPGDRIRIGERTEILFE
ncbi:MAG: FHA domain-containing protein [Armatimonadota bacterium]|nr:FHA domain-containing protein [Armatimonadota bacterium]